MRRFALMALVIVGTMSTPARGTVAYLTSSASASGSVFHAGTVALSQPNVTWSGNMTLSNVAPNTEVYGAVTVRNSGDLSLRYSVATLATQDTVTSTACSSAHLCDLAPFLQVASRYSASPASCDAASFGSLSAFGGSTSTGVSLAAADGTETSIVGDPAVGSANADNHLLAPSESEQLCFKVFFPAAGDYATYGSKGIAVTLKLTAVQASGW